MRDEGLAEARHRWGVGLLQQSKRSEQLQEILQEVKSIGNPEAVGGMARYGIDTSTALGVSIPSLRKIARKVGKSHQLAGELWATGIHEARILAGMIEDPEQVTNEQMERWAGDFNSWDLCDQCCNNLFRRIPLSYEKVVEWASRDEEYVKRAGFTLIACLAVHAKTAPDDVFLKFLPIIARESRDRRNYVKKAVNWALRQIGKRNLNLNRAAIEAARQIREMDTKPAKWIAADALRELESEKVRNKLNAL